jgi:hypothetical protein
MPAHIAEACEWLQAAESSTGEVIDANRVPSALVAGDALECFLMEYLPTRRSRNRFGGSPRGWPS